MQPTFTDVQVIEATTCPSGYTDLYANTFYGLAAACDCRNPGNDQFFHFAQDENQMYSGGTSASENCNTSTIYSNNKIEVGVLCTKHEKDCGCRSIGGTPARRLNQFGKNRICGRYNGLPFVEAVRPSLNGSCPSDYKPCSKKTSPETTICYKNGEALDDSCPITEIKFVDNK